ncbi:c2h2-type zinc finger transcription factor [Gigaspora margarita]|uniref:C2h2-type zinc finger transcription factor n=1 Tax=Gigaspora margarita TaxID=4874 RepID=A0A8H4AN52_GIGMA|nr:c2h2-type zinc finger transcription factor [Gigaspora margarita]
MIFHRAVHQNFCQEEKRHCGFRIFWKILHNNGSISKMALPSGIYAEDVLYNHGKHLSTESLVHSWIIDIDDEDIAKLLKKEGWSEIITKPEVEQKFAQSLMRFSTVIKLETTSFKDKNECYDREKHYDSECAENIMKKLGILRTLNYGYKGNILKDEQILLVRQHF